MEIGVETGSIISNIRARKKIAVDPKFIFRKKLKLKSMLGVVNFKAFEITSDEFFEKEADQLLTEGIDVAFVDGLHTYKQSLRDLENCLRYLNPKGDIVMHDCNPVDYASAYPLNEFQSFDDLPKQDNWKDGQDFGAVMCGRRLRI